MCRVVVRAEGRVEKPAGTGMNVPQELRFGIGPSPLGHAIRNPHELRYRERLASRAGIDAGCQHRR